MKWIVKRTATKVGLSVLGVVVATTALAQLASEGRHGTHRVEKLFARFDANADGMISKDEADQARASMFGELDADGDGAVSRSELVAKAQERAADHASKRFDRLDTNGDGLISQAELAAKSERRFKRVDANGDGVISRDEVVSGMKRHRAPN